MIPAFRVYLFDVDGTLLDSAPDITGAVRISLSQEGIDGLSEPYLRSFIGHHLFDLYREVLPDRPESEYMRILTNYRKIYLDNKHSSTKVYPHVVEMLEKLKGLKSTATTKSSETARAILDQFGLLRFFDHVQGTDGFPAKPEPDVILRQLDLLKARPEECLFVGDSVPDMIAGRRAGVSTCAVTYGYGEEPALREAKPDYVIDSPLALLS